MAKLNDLNGEYIRMMPVEDLTHLILPFVQKSGYVSLKPTKTEKCYLSEVVRLIQERIVKLSDAPDSASFFYRDDIAYDEKGIAKWLAKETTGPILRNVAAKLKTTSDWIESEIEAGVRSVSDEMQVKPLEVIHRVRMAVTHRTYGPGLFELMRVIGRDNCLNRILQAAETDWAAR